MSTTIRPTEKARPLANEAVRIEEAGRSQSELWPTLQGSELEPLHPYLQDYDFTGMITIGMTYRMRKLKKSLHSS